MIFKKLGFCTLSITLAVLAGATLAACSTEAPASPTAVASPTATVAVQQGALTATPAAEPEAPAAVQADTAAAPTEAPTPLPTATPTPEPTATATPVPTATPIDVPTAVPTATAMAEPTPTPDSQAEPTGLEALRPFSPQEMVIDLEESYTADIHTNHGVITVELFASEAPITVNNFIVLARDGFYDGVIFHRVIPNFMIQGGDPTGTGGGGPGYGFQDEIVPSLSFDSAGLLAMANAGPGTNGSQFFITVVPTPHLNGFHTIFGKVTAGQDVTDTISLLGTDQRDRPVDDVVIESIEISGGA